MHDIGFCASVKILCYTLVALFFFYIGFFLSFVLHIYTIDNRFMTILSSSGICCLSFVFNIFGIFQLLERHVAIFLSRTSKTGLPAPQLTSLLPAPRIERSPLLPLSLLFQPQHLLQSLLLLESLLLIRELDDIYLNYKIYLIPESPTNYYLKIFCLIVVSSTRSD